MEGMDVDTPVLTLPPEVLQLAFARLPSPEDLGRALCVCHAWRRAGAAPQLWEPRVRGRWRHGAAAQWGDLQQKGRWHELFCCRAQVEGRDGRGWRCRAPEEPAQQSRQPWLPRWGACAPQA